MHWTRQHPTARKQHQCSICYRTIYPGEKYLRGCGFGEGTAWTWKECAHCEAFLFQCPGIYMDETYGRDDFSEYEPRSWQESIWKMRWRHMWRHGNGALAAVPSSA